MLVEIDNRLYNEFVVWAESNNMGSDEISRYIEKAFRERFTLDKYGDLNEKMVVNEEVNEQKPEEQPKPSKTKASAPVKDNVPHLNEETDSHPVPQPETEPKPKKKTKVIASK